VFGNWEWGMGNWEYLPLSNNLSQQEPRPIGLCEGEFIVPDDFNDPLPEVHLQTFTKVTKYS